MLAGISQSLTVLSLVPLADILGLPNIGDNLIIANFRIITEFLGIQYSLSSVLIFAVNKKRNIWFNKIGKHQSTN